MHRVKIQTQSNFAVLPEKAPRIPALMSLRSTGHRVPTLLLCSLCSLINVTLGAHDVKKQERTQQMIPVRRAVPHPDYDPKNYSNDIMLLQARKPPHSSGPPGDRSFPLRYHLSLSSLSSGCLTSPSGSGEGGGQCSLIMAPKPRGHWLSWTLVFSPQLERKAKGTAAVRPLSLPRDKVRVKPGKTCSVAGWGQVAVGTPTTTLQEAELTVQEDPVCKSLFPGYYSQATQICVGDPRKVKTAFKVRFLASKHTGPGERILGRFG